VAIAFYKSIEIRDLIIKMLRKYSIDVDQFLYFSEDYFAKKLSQAVSDYRLAASGSEDQPWISYRSTKVGKKCRKINIAQSKYPDH
jgi:hypothetical protein